MEHNQILLQFGADLVFYMSLNGIGFYIKYVSEINMRRGFLDKRSCIETTFKLKYEKEQEVSISMGFFRSEIFEKKTYRNKLVFKYILSQ